MRAFLLLPMRFRKLLLRGSFVFQLLVIIAVVYVLITLLASLGNEPRQKILGSVAIIQTLATLSYLGVGLFLTIVIKKRIEMLTGARFWVLYLLHFIVFILPPLTFITLFLILPLIIPRY